MLNLKLVLAFLVVLLSFGIGLFCIFVRRHCAEACSSITYNVDLEFDQFRKVMVRTDSLEEILSYEQGRLIDRNWHKIVLSSERLLNGFDFDTTGDFTVSKKDDDLGELILKFNQQTHIGRAGITTETVLAEPVGYVKLIRTNMTAVPDGQQTVVTIAICLKYERRLPSMYFEEVDRKLAESASKTLGNNKKAVQNLVSKYGNMKFVFPIKLK